MSKKGKNRERKLINDCGMDPDTRYMLIKKLEKEVSYHDRKAFEAREELKKLRPYDWIKRKERTY